jgi:glycosyltransferase involved in cell wall biosynthesis
MLKSQNYPDRINLRYIHYYRRSLVGDGGPTVALWQWVKSLVVNNIDVSVAFDSSLSGNQKLFVDGTNLISITHIGFSLISIPLLHPRHIDSNTVVIIHSAFLFCNLILALQTKIFGGHFVFVPHGAYEKRARENNFLIKKLWLILESRIISKSLAVHLFVRSEIESLRDVSCSVPAIVSPTPISLPSDSWESHGDYIAWFGRYDIVHKGLDILIESYSLIPFDLRVPLLLKGRESKNTREDILKIVKEYGLEKWIEVGSSIEGIEKNNFLKNAKFFVMPSRWESFSIALLEVLALGVPSIVSSAMPISHQLRSENACHLSDIDTNSFSKKMIDALKNENTFWKNTNPRMFIKNNLTHKVVGSNFDSQVRKIIN